MKNNDDKYPQVYPKLLVAPVSNMFKYALDFMKTNWKEWNLKI